ncbi:MAG: TIM barrel protein [Clostridia bacterium]|nr:TIM barrel protein [Clostridia bacterium]
MKIVALIPARAGSKRILHKNLQQLCGIPLLGLAIKQSYEVDLIDEVYVSTDDAIFAKVAENYGAIVPFLRPEYLAEDGSTDYDVFLHFLNWYFEEHKEHPDLIVQIRPTAPIRKAVHIRNAIETIINDKEADSLRTVSVPHQTPYKMWKKDDKTNYLSPIMEFNKKYDGPTQALPKAYAQDGVVDIIRSKTILEKHSMAGEKIIGYTEHKFTWDIDNPEDLEFAKLIYSDDFKINSNKRTLGSNLGIIQGRLTKSEELQQFPCEWKKEFEIARESGYSYIELIRDIEYNPINPLWNDKLELEDINVEAVKQGVATRVICDDYIQKCDWNKITPEQYSNIIDILYKAKKVNANIIVFPLFQKASITDTSKNNFITIINKIANIAELLNIKIALEITDTEKRIIDLINDIKSNNVGICFDTGNLIGAGYNPVEYLNNDSIYNKIIHIHIKDRNIKGENVVLGEGLVDFEKVVSLLLEKNYKGCLTTETSRGDNPIETAIYTKKYLQEKIN